MSLKYLFFAVFIIVTIFFFIDFIKQYRSYQKNKKEDRKTH